MTAGRREEPRRAPDPGRLRTTSPRTLLGCALAGLVLGWSVRPLAIALDSPVPWVGWVQISVLYFVAAILAVAARATHSALQQGRRRLSAHQAVNRLVLGKACALAGALVGGGYLGHALSWVAVSSELATERMVHSLLAAGGAVLMAVSALLLERACRVPGDEDEQP